jgi:hypothetical protein
MYETISEQLDEEVRMLGWKSEEVTADGEKTVA